MPLGDGTNCMAKVDSPGFAPGRVSVTLPACGAGVLLLDDEPIEFQAEADRGYSPQSPDSNSQAAKCRHLFSRQAPGHRPKVGRGRSTSVAG